MKTSGSSKCWIVLAAFAFFASRAQAQDWVHLDPIEWKAKIEVESVKETLEGSGSSRDSEVKTGVTFTQGGYVLDPRIANFSVSANPVISRGEFSSSIRDETRDGEFLNFDVRLNVLDGAPVPYSANLAASRTTDTTKASLGSRSSSRDDNESLTFNWKNAYFPSSISFSQRSTRQTFQSGLTSISTNRDDTERSIVFRGRSTKTNLLVSREWHDDKIPATDNDYVFDRFQLHHLFRWGKGSRLQSRIEYFDRAGFQAYDRFVVNESVTLKHTRALQSSYTYRFLSFRQTQDTIEHDGLFTLTHNLFGNLTTTLQAEARASDLDVSTEDEYRGRLDFEYRKKIPWGGRLGLGLGGGYGVTDRVSSDGLSDVVDEAHGVDSSRLVLLVRRFVVTSTIIVTNATGSLVFTEGNDYNVLSAANNQTQLEIIPGGQINVGETILVSYKFQALPSAKFSTIPYQAHANVDFDWISVFARVSGEEESLLEGSDQGAVLDRLTASYGTELRWEPRPDINATFSIARRTLISGAFNTNSIDLNQGFFYRLNPRAILNLTASQNFITSDGARTNLFNVDIGMRWSPRHNLSVRPHIGFWQRNEKGVSEERFLTGGVEVEYSIGLLSLRLEYTHERRTGTVTDRDEDRIMLTIVRASR